MFVYYRLLLNIYNLFIKILVLAKLIFNNNNNLKKNVFSTSINIFNKINCYFSQTRSSVHKYYSCKFLCTFQCLNGLRTITFALKTQS